MNNMMVDNTKSNRQLSQAVASMAMEEMYFNEEFIKELLKVSNGEKTTEELRQEIIKQYTR
jgi:hypothetical protein